VRTVVVGGSSGLGLEIARNRAKLGDSVVVTSRDAGRATEVASSLGDDASGVVLDLADPATIAGAFDGLDRVDNLVLTAIDRDQNTVVDYDMAAAVRLATIKLVAYTEVVHTLRPRMHDESAIVIFGGRAKDRPYPGSTTVTTVNGAVTSLVRTLVIELAPRRVNALHPAIVGDSPQWVDMPDERRQALVDRTPIGRLVTMAEVVGACRFLLENQAINGINLSVDGGWMCT